MARSQWYFYVGKECKNQFVLCRHDASVVFGTTQTERDNAKMFKAREGAAVMSNVRRAA